MKRLPSCMHVFHLLSVLALSDAFATKVHLGSPGMRSSLIPLTQSPRHKLPTMRSKDSEIISNASISSEGNPSSQPLLEKPFQGILRDLRGRLPLYKSDIKDGLNPQCLASVMFMFFACLAPAIGFGILYAAATGNAIGTMEMVSSTAFGGMIYAAAAAQPLTIIGSTGPVLAFVATLARLATVTKVPFLPLYAWTGLWTSAILFLSSVTSASNIVKYMTRFTDEIFSVLISMIFVSEAVLGVGSAFTSPASTFTKGLLTAAFTATTFTVSTKLKKMRNTSYFSKRVRETISNFGPTIAVLVASLLARWARVSQGTAVAGLPSLVMPPVFGTTSGRPWLIPLFSLPVWARWAAFFPALMATVLLFLDQNITVRLINNPRYKMTKGRRPNNVLDGMHGDMLVISLLTAFQSVLGLPWLVAATVRSLSHVNALQKQKPDGTDEGTMEQRVSGFSIHTLIGCCVLFEKPRRLLAQVPNSVLLGLFMYLGTSTLPGNQLWERMVGFFQDKRLADEKPWTSTVPRRITSLFTAIQVACLGTMFWVKESPFGVLFPVVIAMLAPLKVMLEKSNVIEKKYMDILDSE